MAKAKRTRTYEALRAESDKVGERADCGVIALAIICNVSYKKAHATLKRCGRKDRGATYDHQMRRAIEMLDHRVVRRLKKWEDPERTRTLARIEDSDAVDGGSWLIHVSQHYVGMRERTIHDHTVGRAVRVKSAIKVVKNI